ncbi:MAG TPA: methyltransferase [Stellaceae bacterium]|nr:methyltransferase [Stellaceae bacterium]
MPSDPADEVRAFYESHPYPAPVGNVDRHRELYRDPNRRKAHSLLLWPTEKPRADREILVAGCGTSQAAIHALREPDARVTAIDISKTSLRCTRDLQRRYGLRNLDLHRLPIEEIEALGRVFDQIVCTGVLHHLPDPDLGLRSLRSVLAPNGAMQLMVYAAYGRAGIYMMQEYCRLLGVEATEAELGDLGSMIGALSADHPIAGVARRAKDFTYPSALADARLHPQDRAYTVPQLYAWLGRCGLSFGRWYSTPTHSYMKYLHKYPHKYPLNEYPYLDLIETNRHRNRLAAAVAAVSPDARRAASPRSRHIAGDREPARNIGIQFLLIARAMNAIGPDGMWDEEDGFYYDVLRRPDGSATRLKVRSMVGLLPLCATTVVERWQRERVPTLTARLLERFRRMPELRESIHATGPGQFGVAERGILALVNESRLRRILSRMLDETEFFSPYGIRALSRYHAEHPYVFSVQGQEYRVNYLPAESDTGMFGGNSNWRGPIWMPVNALLIRALLQYYLYYGDNFKIECPTGSGNLMNLFEVAREIANRLTRIFLRNQSGRRPVFGGAEKFQSDRCWRDCLLFYEYFHGDNGAGIGASHQTGWTGLVAPLIEIFGHLDAQTFLEGGRAAAFRRE